MTVRKNRETSNSRCKLYYLEKNAIAEDKGGWWETCHCCLYWWRGGESWAWSLKWVYKEVCQIGIEHPLQEIRTTMAEIQRQNRSWYIPRNTHCKTLSVFLHDTANEIFCCTHSDGTSTGIGFSAQFTIWLQIFKGL